MTDYLKRLKEIEDLKCPKCKGLGMVEDSKLGDTYFHYSPCRDCKGSGLKQNGKTADG